VTAIAAQSLAQQPTTTTPTQPTTTITTPAAAKSLYDRLGGEKAITGIANDFVDRVAKDPKVNFTRHGTSKEWKATPENVTALKHSVAQYLCMATGGPQKYDGKDLKTLHQGMQITATEFDAMSTDFAASLDHSHVAKPEHDEFLKIVAGTKDQIVEQPSKTPTVTPTAATAPTGSKK